MTTRANNEHADPSRYGPSAVLTSLEPQERARLLDVARGAVFDRSGSDFFSGLAHLLYALVGAELVLIGQIAPDDPTKVQTIARYTRGERGVNYTYDLAGTPCETVVGPAKLCAYPQGIAGIFPDDEELEQMGAQGYVGLPLFDRSGTMIGLLALVTTGPIADVETVSSLLRLMGTRASLELEYQIAMQSADSQVDTIAGLLDDADRALRAALA